MKIFMLISKKEFNNSWNNSIKNYSKDLQSPFSWEKATGWEDIAKHGKIVDYNAAIAQTEPGDEYSYEEGYFKAFKSVIYLAREDSDSLVMPAIFLARHFIELTLKKLIFNLSITFGEPIKIKEGNIHELKTLSEDLKNIALKHKLLRFTLDNDFWKIIDQMAEISPKSDEYRYPTNQKGKWNLDEHLPSHLINLVALNNNMNYFYLLTQSLLIIISNSADSVYEGSVYENPYVVELINIVVNGNPKYDNVKDKILGLIDNYKVPLNKKDMEFITSDDGTTVNYNDKKLFTIMFMNTNECYLKTDGLVI